MPIAVKVLSLVLVLFVAMLSHGADAEDSSDPARLSPVLVPDASIQAIKASLQEKEGFRYAAYLSLKEVADSSLARVPAAPKAWHVPGYYRDAEGHRTAKAGLQDDANSAYALALCYRITGQDAYARSALRIITAWSTTIEKWSKEDDSMLSFSYHFPAMIFAADLLRDEDIWPREQQIQFAKFLEEQALTMSTMNRANNWGNWGLVLSAAIAAYLEDEALMLRCVDRWKFFIENQIAADGHLPHEVGRNSGRSGIWYSHFSLMPQTVAAAILKNNGYDLFDYVSPSGRTLEQAYRRLVPWVEEPETFPYWKGEVERLHGVSYYSYFEILNPLWPNDAVIRLLRENRPLTASHSAPFLTLTHGERL